MAALLPVVVDTMCPPTSWFVVVDRVSIADGPTGAFALVGVTNDSVTVGVLRSIMLPATIGTAVELPARSTTAARGSVDTFGFSCPTGRLVPTVKVPSTFGLASPDGTSEP